MFLGTLRRRARAAARAERLRGVSTGSPENGLIDVGIRFRVLHEFSVKQARSRMHFMSPGLNSQRESRSI